MSQVFEEIYNIQKKLLKQVDEMITLQKDMTDFITPFNESDVLKELHAIKADLISVDRATTRIRKRVFGD